MGKGIVPNDDVLGRAVSVLNIGSVLQPEIQVRFTGKSFSEVLIFSSINPKYSTPLLGIYIDNTSDFHQ